MKFYFWLLIIFLIYIIYLLSDYIYFYIVYKKSKYSVESGNSFWKTIIMKDNVFNIKFNSGNVGELLTFHELEKLKGYYKILCNNYIFDDNNLSHESDVILVHETGIYVFESKNYSGWIYGSEKDKHWKQSIWSDESNRKYKSRFYNPIWQNKKHIENIDNYLGNKYTGKIYSYIVFSERCKLKKINYSTNDCTIMNRNNLLVCIKNDIKSKQKIFSTEDIDEIYFALRKNSLRTEEVKEKHIQDITCGSYFNNIVLKEKLSDEELTQNLKKYRKDKCDLEKVPAYFIFTDESLYMLVLNRPINKEELKRVKGFGDNKISIYGDEILEIVNMQK